MPEIPEHLRGSNNLGPEIYANGAFGDLRVDTNWLGEDKGRVHMVLPTNTGAYDERARIVNQQERSDRAAIAQQLRQAGQLTYGVYPEPASQPQDLLGPIKKAVEAAAPVVPLQKKRKIKL